MLNNTDESIELLDSSGSVIDQFAYVSSVKDVVLSTGHYELPVCSAESEEDDSEGVSLG